MHLVASTRFLLLVAFVLVTSNALGQQGPVPDPFVKENATVKVAEHTYVIPDGNVPSSPTSASSLAPAPRW